MPFRLYMIASWLAVLPAVVAFIILGRGIFNGNFQMVLYGVGAVVAVSAIVHAGPQTLCRPGQLNGATRPRLPGRFPSPKSSGR